MTTRHITWFESRNPSRKDRPTFVEVDIRHKTEAAAAGLETLSAEFGLTPASRAEAGDRQLRAKEAADAVGAQAKATARIVRGLHDRLGRRYARTQLSAPEVVASLREFDREYRRLHQLVRHAVDEFLGGNTLVVDFIVDYDVERPEVRHAVRVAALATELRIRTDPERGDEEAFRRGIVDLFLAGFLHDGGMWNEPFCFPDDHEGRGAALAAGAIEDPQSSAAVEKLVVFHSDWARLAASTGAAFVRVTTEALYERQFPVEGQRPSGSDAVCLDEEEHGAALALALAERWITEVEAQSRRTRLALFDEAVGDVDVAPSAAYVAALCNMEIDCVAPRRAWVRLAGTLPIRSPDRKRSERYVRRKVDGDTGGSIGHGGDGGSPHLITLFAPGPQGQRPLESLRPSDRTLWEREGGPDSRWYVPAGRYKNLLDWEVTGFLTSAEYDRILAPYEVQARRRGLLPTDDDLDDAAP